MIKTRQGIIFSLLIPIFALSLLTAYKKYILSIGKEVILPIRGYDPRDLLSGRYLIYQVDYGVDNICNNISYKAERNAYVCLSDKSSSFTRPRKCDLYIKGKCKGKRFTAGIERYYVPEELARDLEKKVMNGSASLKLSVPVNGEAQIKDLLIDGKSWRDN